MQSAMQRAKRHAMQRAMARAMRGPRVWHAMRRVPCGATRMACDAARAMRRMACRAACHAGWHPTCHAVLLQHAGLR
eukprot:359999-Chlamydomonas_euryale.AAC.2